MKKIIFLIAAALVPLCGTAKSADNSGWHFPVALTYASGFNKISDAVIGDFSADVTWKVPVGLSFGGYRQFSNGFGVGLDIGPFMVIVVDVTSSVNGSSTSDTSTGVLMPLGVYCRYDFIREGSVSPFVRAGVRNCFVTGDFFEKSAVGVYANVGVEFSHTRAVRYGLEAGFDTTKLNVYGYTNRGVLNTTKGKEVKPFGFTMAAFVSF